KANVEIETVENNLRFPGQYFDQETGLHYNMWRYYDTDMGRYLRADPIGFKGGINLFIYSFNSPIIMSDSIGLCAILCCDNCESRYETRKMPTGVTDTEIIKDNATVISMRLRQVAAALIKIASPAKIPVPTISAEVKIGEIVTLEEWAEYECLVEICLDDMSRGPLEFDCTLKKDSEYWVVTESEDIFKTFNF
ncbi:MAG: RHS repeat-associated core domain-containing protein, partial [Desulfobacteraceae bacterium]|nr:RHS repeat-associated core domain-containing protein [Desulfobacteraceae bacterium]MBC2758210.1 RHS repeat-associated core domain-containing protein [Desulfobacteraceae bacterium]